MGDDAAVAESCPFRTCSVSSSIKTMMTRSPVSDSAFEADYAGPAVLINPWFSRRFAIRPMRTY